MGWLQQAAQSFAALLEMDVDGRSRDSQQADDLVRWSVGGSDGRA
jgi:hypothetical protein